MAGPESSRPLIQMRGITKWYPRSGVMANDSVDLDVQAGEIHALVGENGAGKSTLMRILVGEESHDSGEVFVEGSRTTIRTPRDSRRIGIGMVHQHFRLISDLTVAQNVILGNEPTRHGFLLDDSSVTARVAQTARVFGLPVPVERLAGQLDVAQLQLAEILKLLHRDARLLVLDEPTAVLSEGESKELMLTLRRLSAEGRTVILISHNVDEVLETADHITVMRGGRVVGGRDATAFSSDTLLDLMLGHGLVAEVEPRKQTPGRTVLELRDVSVTGRAGVSLSRINLSIREGEIVGVTGVAGSGLRTLEDVITGMSEIDSGEICHQGRPLESLARAQRRAEMAYVPSQRFLRGASLTSTVTDNLILGRTETFGTGGLYRRRETEDYVRQTMDRFGIDGAADLPMDYLSGGNRQKVILARELSVPRDLVIFAEPTWGIDVSSTVEIHNRIIELRERRRAVLLISSDLDEILALSDRILVMQQGRLAVSLRRGVSRDALGRAMLGAPP